MSDSTLPEGINPDLLPVPVGYKVLIAMPEFEKKKGNIFIPESVIDREQTASNYGFVIAIGPDAYNDKAKFSKPLCKPGDCVIFRSYTGTRLKVEGVEYRLINDDSVEATVEDPRKIEKAG